MGKKVVSCRWIEKAPGSEGELKEAVIPPTVCSSGVPLPLNKPESKSNVNVESDMGGMDVITGGEPVTEGVKMVAGVDPTA